MLFSHGWNNDWVQATGRYENFVTGYLDQLRQHSPEGGGRAAMLVGVFWPSELLVDPAHAAPVIAGPAPPDPAVAAERQEISELAAGLDGDKAGRFYELAQRSALTEAEAAELAAMFLPLREAGRAEDGDMDFVQAAEVVDGWRSAPPTAAAPVADLDELGYELPAPAADNPTAAASPNVLAPREIVRALSVWQMKHRARTVGAHGVARLLQDLLRAGPRLHLVGHSFGAQVLLTALCTPPQLASSVRSALLLQPAVSHLCFADQVDGTRRPGGYRRALERVELPILSTFSSHDFALTRVYQYAMRRRGDAGEPTIAAAPGEPPNRYAALGGYGPRPLGPQIKLVYALDPGAAYDLTPASTGVYGVNASRTISGHGDVSNQWTWWMLSQLVHGR
ncbi:hypothetical protein ACWCXK_38675 [Streptomyces sp. NPDC001739]